MTDDIQIQTPIVELRPVADLIPYERNARTHSDEQIAQIVSSIREFGWTNPILVDSHSGIIAGHGRLLAAQQLKLERVPVIELSGLSEAQRRAYVIAELGGVQPLLMVTDPPYGVECEPGWRHNVQPANGTMVTARATGEVLNDDNADWRDAWALFPGDACYIWHAGKYASIVQASLEACNFEVRSQIIWAKTRFAISRGDYHWQHEPCWYAVRKTGKGHWQGDRTQSTLWTIEHQKSETGHGTQKPVEAMRRPIVNNSAPGQPVYDPFLGSGTTVIAAETTARCCYGVELSPAYVDVIVQRWQQFTGKAATLDGTDKTFDEIAFERTDNPACGAA